MLLVDEARLLQAGPDDDGEVIYGEARSVVKASWLVLDAGGGLLSPAFFEISAQSFAAIAALKLREGGLKDKPRLGFLVGLKRFDISGRAFVGDRLDIVVRSVASLGEFAVLESKVARAGEVLASGQIKIYAPAAEQVAAMLGADGAEKN